MNQTIKQIEGFETPTRFEKGLRGKLAHPTRFDELSIGHVVEQEALRSWGNQVQLDPQATPRVLAIKIVSQIGC